MPVPEQNKRWVVVAPPGSTGASLLLARLLKAEQEPYVGNQTGGRVTFFLHTDDFWRDYRRMVADGVQFVREPKEAPYGMVAVFEDLYGNLWDLLQLDRGHPALRGTSKCEGACALRRVRRDGYAPVARMASAISVWPAPMEPDDRRKG